MTSEMKHHTGNTILTAQPHPTPSFWCRHFAPGVGGLLSLNAKKLYVQLIPRTTVSKSIDELDLEGPDLSIFVLVEAV